VKFLKAGQVVGCTDRKVPRRDSEKRAEADMTGESNHASLLYNTYW
jgi:hypothetical protein